MKPKSRRVFALLALSSVAALAPSLHAATFTWTQTGAGPFSWDDPVSNWTSGFPNAAGDVANLTANLAVAQTVNLNQAITVGALNVGDPTTGFSAYTIAPNGGSLTFNNSGSVATLSTTNVATGVTNLISSNIILADNLTTNIQNTNALSITGNISESGGTRSLTKTGTGTLTLSGTNTYAGTTQVNVGQIFLNAAGGMANSAIILGNAGGTQTVQGGTTGGFLRIMATPSGVAGAANQVVTTRGASLTFNGAFQGGNAIILSVASNVALGNTKEVFTGALNSAAGFNGVNLSSDADSNLQLEFGSFSRTAGSLVRFNNQGGGGIGRQLIANQNVNETNIIFTTTPALLGTGSALGTSLLKGILIGNSATTYTANGVQQVTTTALADNSITSNNASLAAATPLATGSTVLSLSVTNSAGATSGAGTLTVTSGQIVAGATGTLGNATVDFGSAEGILYTGNGVGLTVNSALAGSGGLTTALFNVNSNAGNIVLAGANTYTGTTRFTGNDAALRIRLTNSLALQNTTLDYNNYGSTFSFGNGTTTGQTAYTFGGLTGAQNINLNNNNTVVAAVALTLGSAGSADTSSTVNTYSGVLSNTTAGGSVIKEGVAKQVLSGPNTYSGGTAVNAGTLLVNNTTGSGLGSGSVTVGNTATLGGTGAFTGNVTIGSGGTLSPGASIQSLGSGALTLDANSTFSVELDSSAALGVQADLMTVNGTFNLNGLVTLQLTDLAAVPIQFSPGKIFSLVNYTGLWNGGLLTYSGNELTNGEEFTAGLNTWAITYNGASGGDNFNGEYLTGSFVNLTAVPEPSAALLGGLGMLFILLRRR